MAGIKLGPVVSDIRGSIGDTTFSRNAAGLYARDRTTPANPNTAAQQAARAVITNLSVAWSATLTPTQRMSWATYALANPRLGQLGQVRPISGYNMFIRTNSLWYREHTAIGFAAAPANPPLWPPQLTFTADAGADTITVALPLTNYPLPLTDSRFWLFAGLPQTAGVSYFSSPWKYIGYNNYASGWLHDPWTVAYPWSFTAAQRLFVYLVAQDLSTGSLSSRGRADLLTT